MSTIALKTIVVTGASTGIGQAVAKRLTREGFRVFGTLRKEEDAERLKAECGPGFVPLLLDITDGFALAHAARTVFRALDGQPLFGLVNNAGIAVPGPLLHLQLDDFRRQFEVNVTAQLAVTQAFAPLLTTGLPHQSEAKAGLPRRSEAKAGRIVMMSSVSAKNAFPFIGAYAASKFALEGLSEALRRELLPFNIPVILIRPGAIATPIWNKAEQGSIFAFAQTPYGPYLEKARKALSKEGKDGLPPERVARLVSDALTSECPRLTYTIRPSLGAGLLLALLPKRALDRLIARRLGLI